MNSTLLLRNDVVFPFSDGGATELIAGTVLRTALVPEGCYEIHFKMFMVNATVTGDELPISVRLNGQEIFRLSALPNNIDYSFSLAREISDGSKIDIVLNAAIPRLFNTAPVVFAGTVIFRSLQ